MSTEATPSGEPKPVSEPKAPGSGPKTQTAPRFKRPSLKLLICGLVALVVLIVGIPRILRSLNTVSTDDAYVNSHITFVAPRVSGQVMQVLVDDNSRVRKGDVLVELDPEPYRVQVAIKQSAVDVAKANLVLADATVRGLMAQARSQRFKLTHAIEDVDNQIALIRQRVATWEESKASLVLAQQEFDRAKHLLESKVVSKEEYDQKQAALAVATAQVTQALGTVVAEIDGVITRRNVNPGNNVQVGQSLMAIRSLRDIWVDANFKETQLRDLRIGQRAELKVDMYGGQHKFEGRISGFFGVLYANTTTLPALLQSLFGYDATTSGLVLSPSGLFAVMGLMVVGTLMSRGVDARYFMG